jgi:hypothetical protein
MMQDEVRAWHINEALTSFRRLDRIIDELTENEVRQALALEASTRRRKSIMDRLQRKAKKLFNPLKEE